MRAPAVRWLAGVWAMTALACIATGQPAPPDSPVADALARASAAADRIASLKDAERTYANTVDAVDELLTRLETETNMAQFMAHVSTDAAERERGQAAEEHVSTWKTEFFKREDVYRAVKAVADAAPALDPAPAKFLRELLRDMRRAGTELAPEKRAKLLALQKEAIKLELEFQKNIAEDATVVPLTRAELAGMSDEYLATLKQSDGLFLLGMASPSYIPVMEQCSVESTRQKAYVAYKRRGGVKNVALIEQIIKLRTEAAKLLGYDTPAHFETEVRMSKSPAAVLEFYEKLRPIVRRKAALDFAEYQDAKRQESGNPAAVLKAWDQMYYETYLRKTRYAVDAEKVREYFPMDAVIDGLFTITQKLYGLQYREITRDAATRGTPLWHADVRMFEVIDQASGKPLGEFYIDLHPRENKYTHAACWPLVPRRKMSDGTIQRPVAALVCNFPKATAEKPALLPHKDVETFFHEFGHVLHNMLTEAEIGSFSGTSVARDFVEAPSQMFENWVWDGAVLKTFARHYKTGEPIPDDLVQGMVRAKRLGSGLWVERQFFYGLCDMRFHSEPSGAVDTVRVQEQTAIDVEQYPVVPQTHFHASFGHLVGYQAGYYGYMWSLVYAADMFQRFKDLGMLSPEAGMYYRTKVLSRGGTMDDLAVVKDYLQREPNFDAFLAQLGLEK